jgi:hypothetical protein
MKVNLSNRQLFVPVFSFVLLYLSVLIGLFFITLNTVGSDYSWGDVDYYHQGLYNFWNGRLFQTSLYRLSDSQDWCPFAYVHGFTIHVNVMNYLMAFPYKFCPNLNIFYAVPLVYNVVGMILFCYVMTFFPVAPEMDVSNPDTKRNVTVFLAGVFLLWGTFYAAITYKGHAPIYATPLFLASYVFVKKERYLPFFLCALSICLIQEDCALWMACYALCLLLFDHKRHFSVFGVFLIGLGYFLLVSFWLQKDAKWYLAAVQYRSDMSMTWHMYILSQFTQGTRFVYTLINNLRTLGSNLCFVGVLIWVLRKQVKLLPLEWGLLLLAPLPHFASLLVGRGGPHHFIPVIGSVIVVVTQMVLRAVAVLPQGVIVVNLKRRIGFLVGTLLLGTYLLSNFILCLNGYILLRAYGVLKSAFYNPTKIVSNRHVAKTINHLIPSSSSLCYWTARDVSGFITGRSDIWRFPYAFDDTDFLVIQKGVNDSFFEFRQPFRDLNLAELAENNGDTRSKRENRSCSSMEPCHILATDTEFFKRLLVNQRKTHSVFYEDDDLLILQSKVHRPIYQPPFTESFYWR